MRTLLCSFPVKSDDTSTIKLIPLTRLIVVMKVPSVLSGISVPFMLSVASIEVLPCIARVWDLTILLS